MDFDFDTGTIFGGLQTLDVTTLPPLGGQVGVLTVLGTGAITLPKGTTVEEPASPVSGMFRYNTDINQLEYYDSTTWQQLTSTAGTVSSFQTSLAGLTPSTATTGAITLAGTLGATSGGTGATVAPTAGQFLYSSAGTTYAATTLAGVAVTTFSAGTTGFTPNSPTSGAITLAGLLGLANGGTNAALTAVAGAPVYSTGSALAIGTAGTSGQAYISGGTGSPSWRDVSSDIDNNPSAILAGDGAGAFIATGGTFEGSPTYSGVTLNGTVTNGTDATTKDYVDSVANGLSWKTSVIVASDVDIDLTTGGLILVDGVTVTAGDRVLVKDQTALEENGIYIASAGTWVRAPDMDSTTPVNEINGAAVFVEQGATWADTAWVQINDVVTLGTDPIVWVQFAGPGSYTAGNGLTLTGNQFSLTTPVSIANGGTALSTTPTNGQLLIGNGTGYTLSTLTAGAGISIGNGPGTITITNFGVTSVTGTANQITASPSTGSVILSTPSVFIAPGSVEVTTTLDVDVSAAINPNLTSGNIGVGLTIYGNTANDLQDWIDNDGTTVYAKFDPAGDFYLNTGFGDSTASLGTSGQILTSTGSAVVWANPAATGVTSFSAGTTGFTPNTATTGAVTLAGTLATTNGGTGLTTIGTANQFLAVNTGATGLEYKTITAGTGISVTPGAGVLTIANTGVTSVALSDASTTPIYSVSGSPVTTTGTLTVTLTTQTANTVFAGPASGGAAQPTFRALVLDDLSTALQLYTENPVTPTTPTATGDNAVAIGSGASATAEGSFAEGDGALARLFGQKAYANGSFAAAGDAQHGVYVLRVDFSTSNTYFEMFLDGTGGTERLVLPDNSVFTFDILVAAVRTDGTSQGAGYRFVGAAKKAGAGTIAFIGSTSKTVIGETVAQWDARITADTGTDAIVIESKGPNTGTVPINWVAVVQTTEVTF